MTAGSIIWNKITKIFNIFNMNNKFDIFISYRREGGFEVAKHIKDLLTRDGYSVSFDMDNLMNGDFNKELLKRIAECEDFILILDANVFKGTLEGREKQKDWLRMELSEALSRDKNVIPVMLDGFKEFPEGLPQDIAEVRYKNGPKYSKEYFDTFYDRLKHFIKEVPTDDITITDLPHNLKMSLLLERGWLLYNAGRYDEAMTCFLDAADRGSANAFNAIALYYYEGHGYERNLQKAFQWFRYAADMGYASAQRNLGDCYLNGEGVMQDDKQALCWYRQAAEKENVKAMYKVGECYANGIGTKKDVNEARRWWEMASKCGYIEAKEKLSTFEKNKSK